MVFLFVRQTKLFVFQRKKEHQADRTWVAYFGNISCCNETSDIVNLMSSEVNSVIRKLKNGMLVGVKGNKDIVRYVFLNKHATNLTTVVENEMVYLMV